MLYRSEIDGLRTIAVLAVIFFHAKFSLFSGGFIGVDLFFVISGFLITSIILRDLAQNTFSLKRFYERRIRRILPALYTVVLVIYIASYFFLLADEFFSLSKSIRYLVFFCSNIFFYRSINYFNPTAENEPLLHTWSLAVEEQIYFVFPVLLLIIWKYAPRLIFPLLCICFLTAFIGTEFFWLKSYNAKFYLAPFRAFEFLLGAICAFICHQQHQGTGFQQAFWKNPFIMRLASIIGLILICCSIVFFTPTTPFPGKYTLIPIFGTALILLFTQQKQNPASKPTFNQCNNCVVTYLLAQPVMVRIGLLSYSFYLWHHPLFTFTRLNSAQEPATITFIGLIFLALILAYLSWRFIETPFRNRQRIATKYVITFAILFSTLLFILALRGQQTKGYINRFTPEQQTLFFASHTYQPFAKRFTEDKTVNQPVLVVIGDSQAQDFVNILSASTAFEGYALRTYFIPRHCQISFKLCKEDYPPEAVTEVTKDADVVIFASLWDSWAIEELPETLAQIKYNPKAELYFIGRKDLANDYFFLRRYLNFTQQEKQKVHLKYHHDAINNDVILSKTIQPEQFISLQHILAPEILDEAPLFSAEGLLIYSDSRHFTAHGAKYLAQLIFSQTKLKKFATQSF